MADRIETELIVKAIAQGFDKIVSEQDKAVKAADRHSKALGSVGVKAGNVAKDLQTYARASIQGQSQAAEAATKLAQKYELVAERAKRMATSAMARGELERAAAFANTSQEADKLAGRYRLLAAEAVALEKKKLSLSNVIDGVKKNFVAITATVLALTGVIRGLKKVWDFAEQGAQVRQQAESFDFLMQKVGVTTDILGGLRKASRGTVDDMTLMSGTATLLAGAGDELAKKLAEATPQLMEIAKASNKLNPSLGTTAFMYESIATGIKRAQPLILDNLGLTIKVGAANQKYADKLGIVVSALSAEQKAMAMLEAALVAGDNLIKQVGGSTESATDAFARLGAEATNAGDRLKAAIGEALGPTASALADMFEESNKVNDIMDELGVTINGFTGNFELAGEAIAGNREELFAWHESLGDVNKRVHDFSQHLSTIPEVDDGVEGSREDLGAAADDTADKFVHLWDMATPDASAMIAGATEYFDYMNSGIPEIVTEIEKIDEAVQSGQLTEVEAKALFSSLSLALANEKIAMGATAKEAATDISKELGIGYQEAYKMLSENVLVPLQKLDGSTVTVTILQEVKQTVSQSGRDWDPEPRAGGGQLSKGWTLVGDPGPHEELISPWGWVYDAQTTKKMLEGGMVPGSKRYVPGPLDDVSPPSTPVDVGGGGGITYDPETYPNDIRGIKPSERPAYLAAQNASAATVEQTAAATAPAAATEAAAAVASIVSSAASIQAQAIQAAIGKQITESKKLLNEMVAVREAIEDLPDPIGARVIHGMETLDTR